MGVTELAVASIVSAVVAAGTSAYASYAQGEAQKEQADYQAKVDEVNAQIAAQQRQQELNIGAQEAAEKRDEARRLSARQRATAQGIDPDSGSMGLLQDETATMGALDSYRIFNNAQRRAFGYEVDEINSMASAAGNRLSGSNAQSAGYMGAASSLLSGAADTMSMAYNFRKQSKEISRTR